MKMKKYKVAVEETSICYYIVEAENKEDAMENFSEGECTSSKPKQEEPLWASRCSGELDDTSYCLNARAYLTEKEKAELHGGKGCDCYLC